MWDRRDVEHHLELVRQLMTRLEQQQRQLQCYLRRSVRQMEANIPVGLRNHYLWQFYHEMLPEEPLPEQPPYYQDRDPKGSQWCEQVLDHCCHYRNQFDTTVEQLHQLLQAPVGYLDQGQLKYSNLGSLLHHFADHQLSQGVHRQPSPGAQRGLFGCLQQFFTTKGQQELDWAAFKYSLERYVQSTGSLNKDQQLIQQGQLTSVYQQTAWAQQFPQLTSWRDGPMPTADQADSGHYYDPQLDEAGSAPPLA
jgi:hypothetical protein